MQTGHEDVREHCPKAAYRFLDIFESAVDDIHCFMSILYNVIQVNHQCDMYGSSKAPCSLENKMKLMNGTPKGGILHAAHLTHI
jgi:hypothetical protein